MMLLTSVVCSFNQKHLTILVLKHTDHAKKLFSDTTFHLVLTLSASLRPKYGTPYLFTSANPKHTLPSDVI